MQVTNRPRIFKWKGIAGACVRPGSSLGRPAPIGDSLIMNFETGFFAVCDGSDRNPYASWQFLLCFEKMVATNAPLKFHEPVKMNHLNLLKDTFVHESNRLLDTALGACSCAITGICLAHTEAGPAGIIFHTGDSSLYEFDSSISRVRELTQRNFWMVGKTRKLFQISVAEISFSNCLILSTDGVPLFIHLQQPEIHSQLSRILCGETISDAPENIMNMMRPVDGFEDDAAVICLSISGMRAAKKRIIMGGGDGENLDSPLSGDLISPFDYRQRVVGTLSNNYIRRRGLTWTK